MYQQEVKKKFSIPMHKQLQNTFWINQEGTALNAKDMDDNHLKNMAAMLRRKAADLQEDYANEVYNEIMDRDSEDWFNDTPLMRVLLAELAIREATGDQRAVAPKKYQSGQRRWSK